MSRFASSTNEAESAKADILVFVAVDMDFPSGHVRVTDAVGNVPIGGNAYSGDGRFQLNGAIEEGLETVTRSFKVGMSGVDAALVTAARTPGYQARAITLYLGFQDTKTQALLDTPEVIREGLMDTISVRLGAGEASIEVSCEDMLRREALVAKYTDSDQQLRHSGDTFFDRLPKIPGSVGKWGAHTILTDLGNRLRDRGILGGNGVLDGIRGVFG